MSESTDDPSTLRAECANCASWHRLPSPVGVAHGSAVPGSAGACMKGLAPPEGEVLCKQYAVSPAFERALLSRLMKDPMVIPVPLKGKKARELRRRRRKGQ